MAHAHSHGGHDHHHGGGHHPAPPDLGRAFALGTALNLAFVAAEMVFGFAANSLALIADAAHNFSDVIGLLLAWGAALAARRPPTASHTYGYRRASILAALANAGLLLLAVGGIVVEAVRRVLEPQPVAATTVLAVAAVGIVINTATALLFLRGRNDDINVRGAFLHMTADAAVSVGVVVAALAISGTGWAWIDPAVSLLVAFVILASSWGLAREALRLSLDAVPAGIDRAAVERCLAGLPGVTEVHDLHIWAMSTTETALTAHLVRPGAALDDCFLVDASHALAERFGIRHATLQVEAGDGDPCRLAPPDVV